MGRHTVSLEQLVADLHPLGDPQASYCVAARQPLDLSALKSIDRRLGGPHLEAVSRNGRGCFEASDRDVFRPLQYCAAYFALAAAGERDDRKAAEDRKHECGGCAWRPLS